MWKCIELTGKKFGRLTVLGKHHKNNENRWYWECLCDCGNKKVTQGRNLLNGQCVSCGCYNRENMTIHGMTGTNFYDKYVSMRQRCNTISSGNFKNYGARGIKCLWESFVSFKIDMYKSYLEHISQFGEKQTTIDRINPFGNYEKENCRWATYKEQGRNKRYTKKVTYRGKTYIFRDLCDKFKLPYETITRRIHQRGWSIEDSFDKPIKH